MVWLQKPVATVGARIIQNFEINHFALKRPQSGCWCRRRGAEGQVAGVPTEELIVSLFADRGQEFAFVPEMFSPKHALILNG